MKKFGKRRFLEMTGLTEFSLYEKSGYFIQRKFYTNICYILKIVFSILAFKVSV